jgi:hypothetical protein
MTIKLIIKLSPLRLLFDFDTYFAFLLLNLFYLFKNTLIFGYFYFVSLFRNGEIFYFVKDIIFLN